MGPITFLRPPGGPADPELVAGPWSPVVSRDRPWSPVGGLPNPELRAGPWSPVVSRTKLFRVFCSQGVISHDSVSGIAATSSSGLGDLDVTQQRFKDLALQNHRRVLDPTTACLVDKLKADSAVIADVENRRKAQVLTALVWRLGGNTRPS